MPRPEDDDRRVPLPALSEQSESKGSVRRESKGRRPAEDEGHGQTEGVPNRTNVGCGHEACRSQFRFSINQVVPFQTSVNIHKKVTRRG